MAITTERSDRAGLTRGQIVVAGSAILLILAFFLPWINTGTSTPSGLALALAPNAMQALGIIDSGISTLLYLIPVLAALALALAFVRQPAAGPAISVAGLLSFIVLVVLLVIVTRAQPIVDAVTAGGTPLPFIAIGLWLALLSVIAMSVGGVLIAGQYLTAGAALNTRRIVTAGMLGAIAITLGVTQLGFIAVPNITQRATIMHIPAIIGAALEGPVVGIAAGAIFGLFSWLNDTSGLFGNPVIAVLPRLLIGFMAWLAYSSLVRVNRDLAAVVAGIVGTLTNTILVVTLLIAFGLIPVKAVPTIIPQAIAELVVAAILTPVVVRAVVLTRSGRTTAEDKVPRDKSYY